MMKKTTVALALATAIETDLSRFAGPLPLDDERTTVLIRRLPS